jgi:hypothetical protein
MHARVVRFTDVSSERISELVSRVENDGPPPGTDPSRVELFFDESQGTAIFVGYFDSEEKLREASAVFESMDASDTPGSRATVDLCELKVQRSL